jgi:hypothetical protein
MIGKSKLVAKQFVYFCNICETNQIDNANMSKLKFIKNFIKIKDFFQNSCEILCGLLVKILSLFTMKFRSKKNKNDYSIRVKKTLSLWLHQNVKIKVGFILFI